MRAELLEKHLLVIMGPFRRCRTHCLLRLRRIFLPLADGEGDTHISCLHLETGGKVESHATALLIVHGRVTIEQSPGPRIKFSGGMGAMFQQNKLNSETNARSSSNPKRPLLLQIRLDPQHGIQVVSRIPRCVAP